MFSVCWAFPVFASYVACYLCEKTAFLFQTFVYVYFGEMKKNLISHDFNYKKSITR